YIRDFGRWLQANGNPHAYALSDRWKAGFVAPQPYLLTSAEIEAFFAAAGRLDTCSPWAWQATAFFTLMHSCGLRTGEVRALGVEHVDLAGAHIEVWWSKGHRSRRLPLSDDVVDVLSACHWVSTARLPGRRHFFVSSTGNPVTPATVGVIFNRIWDAAGLARPTEGKRPRSY